MVVNISAKLLPVGAYPLNRGMNLIHGRNCLAEYAVAIEILLTLNLHGVYNMF